MWFGQDGIAQGVLGDRAYADEVGWLSIGVALTVTAAGQTAWLTGLRRVGDLARVSIGTGLIAAAISITGLLFWGHASTRQDYRPGPSHGRAVMSDGSR